MKEPLDNFSNMRIREAARQSMEAVSGDPEKIVDEVRLAAILELVLHGWSSHSSAKAVNMGLPPDRRFHSDALLLKATGGLKGLVRRMSLGHSVPEGVLGDWSPDFLYGLTMSKAILPASKGGTGGCFSTTQTLARPALRAAFMGALPFHCKAYPCPDRVRLTGLWAARLGPDDPKGIGVLAGLLAGGSRVERKDEGINRMVSWIGVPASEWNGETLREFGIPHELYKEKVGWGRAAALNKGYGKGRFLISPFWGALLSAEMPEEFRRWFEGWEGRNKGGYRLMTWGFVKLAWGAGSGIQSGFPPGCIPFLSSLSTMLHDEGIKCKDIRETCFRKYGFSRVDPRVRGAWLKRMKSMGIKASDFPYKVPVGMEDFPD